MWLLALVVIIAMCAFVPRLITRNKLPNWSFYLLIFIGLGASAIITGEISRMLEIEMYGNTGDLILFGIYALISFGIFYYITTAEKREKIIQQLENQINEKEEYERQFAYCDTCWEKFRKDEMKLSRDMDLNFIYTCKLCESKKETVNN